MSEARITNLTGLVLAMAKSQPVASSKSGWHARPEVLLSLSTGEFLRMSELARTEKSPTGPIPMARAGSATPEQTELVSALLARHGMTPPDEELELWRADAGGDLMALIPLPPEEESGGTL